MSRTYRRKNVDDWDIRWIIGRIRHDDESMAWSRYYNRRGRDKEHMILRERALYHSDNYPMWGGVLPWWERNSARRKYRMAVKTALWQTININLDRDTVPPDAKFTKGKSHGYW
jgi:hypothetical protein